MERPPTQGPLDEAHPSQSAVTLTFPENKIAGQEACAALSQHKNNSVQIWNPSPSGARYTSRKNAERLVKRGLAVYARGGIEYVASEWLATLGAYEAARRLDDRMVEERGGVLWWNGCDHRRSACHVPGENVALPRPDRAGSYIQAMKGIK